MNRNPGEIARKGLDGFAPAGAAAIPDTGPAHVQRKHVLYVDDDPALLFLMRRMLERKGYRVSTYTDPIEALVAVRAAPDCFDLVVTDYNMPCMSGLEFAIALRGVRVDLPVAIASAYITAELRTVAPAAGVKELIHKPVTADELFEVLARLANGLPG